MFSIENQLIQLWIGSFTLMVTIAVVISVWAAWRTITRQRSQLLSVNTELDARVTDLSLEIERRQQAEKELAKQAAALARADEVRLSRKRIITAEETLRRKIAQQLHGSVQNRLIFLTLRLKELEKAAAPEGLAAELRDLHQKFEELLDGEIRSISHQLYPYILHSGFVPALQSLGDQFEGFMEIDLQLDQELMRRERSDRHLISDETKLAAYRIAEEALTNVVKHAKASKVTVKLDMPSPEWIRISIKDNGQGFDPEKVAAGLGIVGMRDYAEAMGGECAILRAKDQGTEVSARLPLATPVATPAPEHPQTVSP